MNKITNIIAFLLFITVTNHFTFPVFAAYGNLNAVDINQVQAAAERGNPLAQTMLGKRLRSGDGVPKDLNMAAYWFDMAARQGYMEGQVQLGNMFARGEVQPPNNIYAYLMVSVAQREYPRCSILRGYKERLISHMSPKELSEAEQLLRAR